MEKINIYDSMSKEDLMNAFGANSSDFAKRLQEQVNKALIINVYLNNGDMIKIGDGSPDRLKISSIFNISNDYFSIKYDSHDTDILYASISKIEFFYARRG